MPHHLAQINLAYARAPLDSPVMRNFVEALAAMNALAEGSPGFVWRFTKPAGDPSLLADFPDPRVLVNMSVWTDLKGLKDYAYRSMHGRFFARRAEWFEPMTTPHLALWWIPAGTTPTLKDAKRRLALLAERGETAEAFAFRTPFAAPAG